LEIARSFAGTAIDNQVPWTLCHLVVEVVHEHAHGSFLGPCLAVQLIATRGLERRGVRWLGFCFNRPKGMVAKTSSQHSAFSTLPEDARNWQAFLSREEFV